MLHIIRQYYRTHPLTDCAKKETWFLTALEHTKDMARKKPDLYVLVWEFHLRSMLAELGYADITEIMAQFRGFGSYKLDEIAATQKALATALHEENCCEAASSLITDAVDFLEAAGINDEQTADVMLQAGKYLLDEGKVDMAIQYLQEAWCLFDVENPKLMETVVLLNRAKQV